MFLINGPVPTPPKGGKNKFLTEPAVVGSLIESANQPYDNAEIYHLITE